MEQKKVKKREKKIMLNELTQLTGYNRSYDGRVSRKKKVLCYLSINGKRVNYILSGLKKKSKGTKQNPNI